MMKVKEIPSAFILFGALLITCFLQIFVPLSAGAENAQTLSGTLNLNGETFGAGTKKMVNAGTISGFGIFEAEQLTNRGSMRFTGGETVVNSRFENIGTIEVMRDRTVFNNDVINHGRVKITDAVVTFNGTYTEHGNYYSDPSEHYHFGDLIIGTSGYLIGGEGDNWYLSADFINSSTQNTLWDTDEAYLEFRTGTDTAHDFHITGLNYGSSMAGYTDNFAWSTLNVASGNSITLIDGNAATGGALYVKEMVGAQISGTTVTNISGSDYIWIYYLASESANAYLGGQVYDFTGNGKLAPIPYTAIPTVSEWGMIIFYALLLGSALWVMRQRRRVGQE